MILKKKQLWIIACLSVLMAAAVLLFSQQKPKTDLTYWINKENRIGLLPKLLDQNREKARAFTHASKLPATSPIYGLNEIEVITLLGPPDYKDQDELVYHLGNLSNSYISNLIVPQNASLHLYFINGRCIEYARLD